MLAHPNVLRGATTTFRPRSGWYCEFGCTGWFCGADGCGWVCCVPGDSGVAETTLTIFDTGGNEVFSKTVTNQGDITWDGRDNNGRLLANGPYLYIARITITDGGVYTYRGTMFISR